MMLKSIHINPSVSTEAFDQQFQYWVLWKSKSEIWGKTDMKCYSGILSENFGNHED